MSEDSSTHPHIKDEYAPLQDLIVSALRIYGDQDSGSVSSAVQSLMLMMANQIIDEYRMHPYAPLASPISYYVSVTESRPIPNNVMIAGLTFHYAIQQNSSKAASFGAIFYRALNQHALRIKYGGPALPQMSTPDKPAQ